jgi:hypothetical protein
MNMSEKSEGHDLYFCMSRCRVVTFIPDREVGGICPKCGHQGIKIRSAVSETDHRARKPAISTSISRNV